MQNHKLFTEEPTMISQCELSQDVSGASFPQYILQTLIEKQKDGLEEPDHTAMTEQQQQ